MMWWFKCEERYLSMEAVTGLVRFLQTSQASGDSDDSTTGRSGNNTVNLDRMDTFEDSVSIFAYAVSRSKKLV